MSIDGSKPVLVTGGNGYIAGWLIKKLLEEGITVHATVRNPEAKHRLYHLDQIAAKSPGTLKYFKADLLLEGGYAEAMKECEVVFHMASPFIINVKDPQRELIDPAVKGTANVLEQANKTPSVKRIVLTSSVAAIYTDAIECQIAPNGILTESIWNTTASLKYHPYSYSKTLAEQKAWQIFESQDQWKLVSINPSYVMGPALNPRGTKSESISLITQMGNGSLKFGMPNLGMGLVDVRDVAEAHFRAGYYTKASGRYITSAHNTNLVKLVKALVPKYGKSFPLPKGTTPKWLLMLIGPIINKAITRRFVRNNINIEWKADNTKIREELVMSFIPIKKTMEDSFQALIDEGILEPKRTK